MLTRPFFIGIAASALTASGGTATAQEVLKIGVIQSMTGAFNTGGKAVVNGVLLYLKQHGDIAVSYTHLGSAAGFDPNRPPGFGSFGQGFAAGLSRERDDQQADGECDRCEGDWRAERAHGCLLYTSFLASSASR